MRKRRKRRKTFPVVRLVGTATRTTTTILLLLLLLLLRALPGGTRPGRPGRRCIFRRSCRRPGGTRRCSVARRTPPRPRRRARGTPRAPGTRRISCSRKSRASSSPPPTPRSSPSRPRRRRTRRGSAARRTRTRRTRGVPLGGRRGGERRSARGAERGVPRVVREVRGRPPREGRGRRGGGIRRGGGLGRALAKRRLVQRVELALERDRRFRDRGARVPAPSVAVALGAGRVGAPRRRLRDPRPGRRRPPAPRRERVRCARVPRRADRDRGGRRARGRAEDATSAPRERGRHRARVLAESARVASARRGRNPAGRPRVTTKKHPSRPVACLSETAPRSSTGGPASERRFVATFFTDSRGSSNRDPRGRLKGKPAHPKGPRRRC